ncbi:MAG: hypothetical protein O2793_13765 [Proteobacteria bacterium]|nr:hypothetical protein [Pseudomonadota bacterium]MDA1254942.1 hypothetical protein [Pseudomonadota bacterium]
MKYLLVLLVFISSNSFAGKPVYAIDTDLGQALDKAVISVEKAAVVHGTCVSEYPSLESCEESIKFKGYFQCRGIRANHKGSCANKPTELDNLIKAANGLKGSAATDFLNNYMKEKK